MPLNVRGTYQDNWCSKQQADSIMGLARSALRPRATLPAKVSIVEIGCWEGYSTAHIANAVSPFVVYAIDHWRGNVVENPEHGTVQQLRVRDVYRQFLANIDMDTPGNVQVEKTDWRETTASFYAPIAFLYVDAEHDCASVYQLLSTWVDAVVPGGIIAGDDWLTAHAGRADLHGGVERAVRTFVREHNLELHTENNLWWVVMPENKE
jgi:predicted O-methyltransferase YrrM